jgi:hypothetical protein
MCLRLPAAPALKYFSMCVVFDPESLHSVLQNWKHKVTSSGVLAALQGRTNMRRLRVLGLYAGDAPVDYYAQLRAIVGNRSNRMDVTGRCRLECDRLVATLNPSRPMMIHTSTSCSECERRACRFCIKQLRKWGNQGCAFCTEFLSGRSHSSDDSDSLSHG